MFNTINNRYKKLYYQIINSAKDRSLPGEFYTESHHIIPKSCGGTNDKENLVDLTAREHYLVHLLLTKFTKGVTRKKMIFAWHRVSYRDSTQTCKTSKMYQRLREEHAIESSLSQKGKPKPHQISNRGKTHEEIFGAEKSASIKENIRKANSARVWTDQMRRNMAKAKSNPSLETRKQISQKQKERFADPAAREAVSVRRRDKTVSKWIHPKFGIEECTRHELKERYPDLKINTGELGKVISGEYKSHKGWKCTPL